MKRQISILPRNNPKGRNWFHRLQPPTYCSPVAWARETRLMPSEFRNALPRLSAAVALSRGTKIASRSESAQRANALPCILCFERLACGFSNGVRRMREANSYFNYATPKLCGTYDCVTPLIWLQVFLDRIYILRQL